MTDAERELGAKRMLADFQATLARTFGKQLKPAIASEWLGDAQLHRPALLFSDIPGWKPPAQDVAEPESIQETD